MSLLRLLAIFTLLSFNSHGQGNYWLPEDFLVDFYKFPISQIKFKKITQYCVLQKPNDDPDGDSLIYKQQCQYILEFDTLNRASSFSYNFEKMSDIQSDSLVIDTTQLNCTIRSYMYLDNGVATQVRSFNDQIKPKSLGETSVVIRENKMVNGHYNDILIHSDGYDEFGNAEHYNYEYEWHEHNYRTTYLFKKVIKTVASQGKKVVIYLVYEYYD